MPHGDAAGAVGDDAFFHQLHEQHRHGGHAAHAGADEPALYAAHRHHDGAGAHDQDRAGQVRLQQHQNGNHAKNRRVGQYPFPPLQHFLPLLGDAVGEIDDDRQLGDLRRLEGKHALDAQPAGGVVAGDAHMGDDHQYQQTDGEDQQHTGRAAPALIVDLAHHEHGEKTQRGENALPLEVVSGVGPAGLIEGGGKAGGKQHHKADTRQHQRQQQEGNIHAPALGGQNMLAFHRLASHFFGIADRSWLLCHGVPSFLM